MRTEISQAKKEANFYLQNVEKGKAIDAMETRKRKRADQVGLQYVCPLLPHPTHKKITQMSRVLMLYRTGWIQKIQKEGAEKLFRESATSLHIGSHNDWFT